MSEVPDDTDFKLRLIVTALRDVNTEWYDLGIYLDLPEHILKPIGSNPDVEGRLRMMVSKWLGYDPQASWDKLAAALNAMGKNTIAANIRSKYVRADSETHSAGGCSASDQGDNNSKARKYTLNFLRYSQVNYEVYYPIAM